MNADQGLFVPLILGIIEGLTEFLPVSSTAHILLAGHFLGFNSPGRVFEVLIQLGAILAILVVYFQRLLGIAKDRQGSFHRMPRLLQHRLDPSSRLARLMFAEYGVGIDLEDIKPWRREPGLLEINPAATVPILAEDGEPPVVGTLAVIHAIEDRYVPAAVAGLFPSHAALRNEMWRLLEWVMVKHNDEVTRYVLEEKIVKRD